MQHDYRRTVQQSTGDAHGAANVHTSKNKSNKIPQDANKRGSRAGRRRSQQQNIHALLPNLMKVLGTSMEARLKECAVSDENAACADRCFQELQAVVVELGPWWRFEVFGSVVSGFRTSSSDMDATCVQAPSEGSEEESPVAQTILQERLSPLLRQNEQFQVIEEIFNAKVPILRLRFEGHLDIDLSCQNTAALLNTRLLSAYANFHPRVRDLGIAVKLWAKAAHVCGAAQGNLSSYSFTLLVIYFMQVHHEVNLPCLPTSLFEEDAAVAEAEVGRVRRSWSCSHSLADLFFRFIGFYSLFFDWGREVVSARCGKRIYSRDPTFQRLRGRHVSRLHIEDPYALERNLHCVLGEAEEVQLREALQSAWYAMINGATPVGLRPLSIHPKIEIQLDRHTLPFSDGHANATLDDGDKPEMGLAERDSIVEDEKAASLFSSPHASMKLSTSPIMQARTSTSTSTSTESPTTFSSSGSTESGDDKCAPHVPSSSSGESRQSDDDCMTVDKDVAANNSKQWWQKLASADIAEDPARLPQDDAFVEQSDVPLPSAAIPDTAQEHLQNLARRIASKVRCNKISNSEGDSSAPPSIKAESLFSSPHASMKLSTSPIMQVLPQLTAPTDSPSASLAEGGSGWWRNLGSANIKQAVEASGQEEEGGRWSRRKRGLRHGVTVQDLEGKMIQESPQDFCDFDNKDALNSTILPLFGGSFASTSSSKIASRVANRCVVQA